MRQSPLFWVDYTQVVRHDFYQHLVLSVDFLMRVSRRTSLLVLSLSMVIGITGWARGWLVATETNISELAPGVFFRKAQTEPVFTGCNQGWVIFKDFVLVNDANFPGQADEVIKTIRKYTDKPIRYVFDTHHHGDHAGRRFPGLIERTS